MANARSSENETYTGESNLPQQGAALLPVLLDSDILLDHGYNAFVHQDYYLAMYQERSRDYLTMYQERSTH